MTDPRRDRPESAHDARQEARGKATQAPGGILRQLGLVVVLGLVALAGAMVFLMHDACTKARTKTTSVSVLRQSTPAPTTQDVSIPPK